MNNTPHHTPVGPARAGMVLAARGPTGVEKRRPRTRGDGPDLTNTVSLDAESAPHARGWSSVGHGVLPGGEVGPARAGMVP